MAGRTLGNNVIAVCAGIALITASIPSTRAAASPAPESAESATFSGKVAETINAATYTYVLVNTGKDKKWAAAPQFEVKVGDAVTVTRAMAMPNYHSKTLNRDFDVVYFTGTISVGGKGADGSAPVQALPKDHPPIDHSQVKQAAPVDVAGVKKADGGKTVEEIVSGSAALRGKPVKVRGKVVKYNSMVMGKNWLHIRDGSGAEGRNDLTVTTAANTKVGDTVLVNGTVSTDRDFGGGYRYNVIIEDAKVTVEQPN